MVAWVKTWAERRRGLRIRIDPAGNLLLAPVGRRRRPPLVAVAHLDHPGFVVASVEGRRVVAEFRGFVDDAYVLGARVELFDPAGGVHPGRVTAHEGGRSEIVLDRSGRELMPGSVGRWRFPRRSLGIVGGRLRAPGCDDLVGVAAALEALDRARRAGHVHFQVLLTRAEEVGFVGAIAAARAGTVPTSARILSVETSRALPDAPVGGGPIVRVGDAATVFDASLTNRMVELARQRGIVFRRRLMDGGSCEATAFGAFGYPATGVCIPLGNYHNMADTDGERGPRLAPEVIDLADFDGLVRLLAAAAGGIDEVSSDLEERLAGLYAAERHLL